MSGEFDIIGRYFAPLAIDAGAFGLSDDAALFNGLVITKDLLVEGVHFRGKDPLDLVAKKALRVNLSDIAAKGAKPLGYFLGCVWPSGVKDASIADFARGLAEDQDSFRISLLGGDTTVQTAKGAPLTISITMLGAPASAGLIRRSGALAGDDLYVTGTIGDAGLGLRALDGAIKTSVAGKKFLADRYRLPVPRVATGGALAGLASAAIDISDGLLADAGHLADTSGVGFDINAEKIPLSPAALAWLDQCGDRSASLCDLTGMGDDYEILFTAPASRRRSIDMAAQVTRTQVTRIGAATRVRGVRLLNESGAALEAPRRGYDHFGR